MIHEPEVVQGLHEDYLRAGSSVITPEIYASRAGIVKTISPADARWRPTPFTLVLTDRVARSGGGSCGSPTGQNVSNPLARVHCESDR